MITTRDIKVFIFSIFITTLCLAFFKQPINEAMAQGPGGPPAIASFMGCLKNAKHKVVMKIEKINTLISRVVIIIILHLFKLVK
jgi:hypothetical protein